LDIKMTNLEDALRNSPLNETDDVIGDIAELHKSNLLDEPIAYVSPTDKMFDKIMEKLGEHKRGDISLSVKPLYTSDKKIDGAFVSFKVTL